MRNIINFGSIFFASSGLAILIVAGLGIGGVIASVATFGIFPLLMAIAMGTVCIGGAFAIKLIDLINHSDATDVATQNSDGRTHSAPSLSSQNASSPTSENASYNAFLQWPSSPPSYPVLPPPPYSKEVPRVNLLPMQSGDNILQVRVPRSKLYSFFSSLLFKSSSQKKPPSYEEIFSNSSRPRSSTS